MTSDNSLQLQLTGCRAGLDVAGVYAMITAISDQLHAPLFGSPTICVNYDEDIVAFAMFTEAGVCVMRVFVAKKEVTLTVITYLQKLVPAAIMACAKTCFDAETVAVISAEPV